MRGAGVYVADGAFERADVQTQEYSERQKEMSRLRLTESYHHPVRIHDYTERSVKPLTGAMLSHDRRVLRTTPYSPPKDEIRRLVPPEVPDATTRRSRGGILLFLFVSPLC